LQSASEYGWRGRVLFNGGYYPAQNLPWDYAPRWFLISTPPVVIVGALLSLLVLRKGWILHRAALWTVAVLPVVAVIVKNATLYDGVRHLLFVYPVLVVLAASGWAALLSTANRPWVRRSAAAALAVGLANILVFNVRAYPHQGVYFNELVGGPRGAMGKFDLDYWGNCVLEAVAWTADAARSSQGRVVVSGNPAHLVQINAERFPGLSFATGRHDLSVRLNRGSPRGVAELAARTDALYKVQTPDGAVLCVVLPGPAFADSRSRISLPATQSSLLSSESPTP
jgi:hypothetical protein